MASEEEDEVASDADTGEGGSVSDLPLPVHTPFLPPS